MPTDPLDMDTLEKDRRRTTTQIRPPSHRHAAPSAPWPWINTGDPVNPVQLASRLPPIPEPCMHESCGGCWRNYPKSRFPNWTENQVRQSKIYDAIHHYDEDVTCRIHWVDVDAEGLFSKAGNHEATDTDETWEFVKQKASDDTRIHAIFVESMSGPVLQMLGTRYNIEPFFFSSSLNWIPSRFQSHIRENIGDHITFTLIFLRAMAPHASAALMDYGVKSDASEAPLTTAGLAQQEILANKMINTHGPLPLSSGRTLVLDLLSVHVVRRSTGSVIISFHPHLAIPTTTAPVLHERIQFAGQSVYWQNIFQRSSDPTFVVLMYIWHAMYAWDEAMEHLYDHICYLETQVIKTSQMSLTQQLHIIRAHHLHYSSLLEDFRKTIEFIRDTENPALSQMSIEERQWNKDIMQRETATLLAEVARLETGRRMQDRRLKNVMDLVFSTVNILDSKRMQQMAETSSRDSAAMKQIAYLTMIFLPASFTATAFGMNVEAINPGSRGSLDVYIGVAVGMTAATIWVIVAFQNKHLFPPRTPVWKRLAWPYVLPKRRWLTGKHTLDAEKDKPSDIEINEELAEESVDVHKEDISIEQDEKHLKVL